MRVPRARSRQRRLAPPTPVRSRRRDRDLAGSPDRRPRSLGTRVRCSDVPASRLTVSAVNMARCVARAGPREIPCATDGGLDDGEEPEQQERGERGEEEHDRPDEEGADLRRRRSARPPVSGLASAERRDGERDRDDDFGEDEGDDQLGESVQDAARAGPDERGVGERAQGEQHVQEGGAHQQLDPQHEGAEDRDEPEEEDDEGRLPG